MYNKSFFAKQKKKKDDPCVRAVKKAFKVYPSAYASGALVRCRKGEIFKDQIKKYKKNL